MAISFLCALGLPLVLGVDLFGVSDLFGWAAGALGTLFVLLWLVAVGVRHKAGANGGLAAMTIRVVIASALLAAVATAVLWGWSESRWPEDDFLHADEFHIVLGAWAAVTFVVVSVTLSSVRKAASRLWR